VPDPGPLKRILYPPSHSKGPSKAGSDVKAVKRAISRAGFWKWQEFSDNYTNDFSHGQDINGPGVAGFQWNNGFDATGTYGEGTHDKLRKAKVPKGGSHAGEDVFDQTACDLYKSYAPKTKVPDLGPVVKGGKKVTAQDLTHPTGGLSLYPAFDDGFAEGVTVIAPEDLEITKASSSNPGDACYAKGKSGLQYWFGHLASAPAVGKKIAKGGTVGKTCHNEVGGGPHVHLGVNVEKLWGSGKQMTHHTNYTHGAPLIGEQLEAGHAL
jgi:hypothetical protein